MKKYRFSTGIGENLNATHHSSGLSLRQPHNDQPFLCSTFTFGDEAAPHPLAVLQMARDGVGPLRLDEALLTHH